MQIKVNKKFLKELSLLPFRERRMLEKLLFEDMFRYNSPAQIPNIGKLKGYDHYFKIRIGNYRAGLKIEKEVITFERILHRKEIYRYYP